MKYGLQLFSIRDAAEKNFDDTLRQVAEMGYDMVETAGFFGLPAEEVKAMLAHYGLTICSTHTPYRDVFTNLEQTIEYHKKVGCQNIILPSAPLAIKEEVDYTVACINRFQPIIEAEGLKLHYHNHSREFMPNKDGIIAEEELVKRTNVLLEIDTFWTFNAGLSSVDVLEQYKDRISFIHLKDGLPQDFSDPSSRPHGRSLGSGLCPVADIRKKAIELGFSMVVESEGLKPSGPEESKRCIDYLRTLDAQDLA